MQVVPKPHDNFSDSFCRSPPRFGIHHERVYDGRFWANHGLFGPEGLAIGHVGGQETSNMNRRPSRRAKKPAKSVLLLPDLEHGRSAVLNSLSSADAQRGYESKSSKVLSRVHRKGRYSGWTIRANSQTY